MDRAVGGADRGDHPAGFGVHGLDAMAHALRAGPGPASVSRSREGLDERRDTDAACHLAGQVPAHAVAQHGDPVGFADDPGVLVLVPTRPVSVASAQSIFMSTSIVLSCRPNDPPRDPHYHGRRDEARHGDPQ